MMIRSQLLKCRPRRRGVGIVVGHACREHAEQTCHNNVHHFTHNPVHSNMFAKANASAFTCTPVKAEFDTA